MDEKNDRSVEGSVGQRGLEQPSHAPAARRDGALPVDEGQHAARVDAWLQRVAEGVPVDVRLRLFEAALSALWARTETTLGVVTLTAIADRVLHYATEKYPALAALTLDASTGVQYGALHAKSGTASERELTEGIRFVLVEFLTVLGNLTAELLTEELHSELSGVALPSALQIKNSAKQDSHTTGPDDEDKRS